MVLLLQTQSTIWAWKANESEGIGWINNVSESYGYGFDYEGHRYLKVGTVYREKIYIPANNRNLEFRVRNAISVNPITIKAMILDTYQKVQVANGIELEQDEGIRSLVLEISKDLESNRWYDVVLLSNTVELQGSLLNSDEREMVGFYYYGYRTNWNSTE